jgi:site-specific DNA-methyltransferase (adenine-specific)
MAAFSDSQLTILVGDCREKLRDLPAESVQTIVTSPPYWGLRDYGTGKWIGGIEECDHLGEAINNRISLNENTNGRQDKKNKLLRETFSDFCGKCGAKRVDSQLGVETSPEKYVENMVSVFREAKRVLRDDGTLWLNLGDSYASGGMSNPSSNSTLGGGKDRGAADYSLIRLIPDGLKPKDLVGIPWRVAFALQADGWYLRSEIIWAKPNPMPESVTDRPTKSHEQIFLLSKSAKYFYDAQAIKEEAVTAGDDRGSRTDNRRGTGYNAKAAGTAITAELRNKRSVWVIPTQPYGGAHFATFPPALIEPCILAGAPVGGVVLDPFGGSGTTALVANRLGRKAVLIELNEEYVKLIKERNAQASLGI